VAEENTERRHEWVEGTLLFIRDPWIEAHPHHAEAVQAALDLIASDPYAIALRPYLGHDATGEAYAYAVPGTSVDIVFCLIRPMPGRLGLYAISDWNEAVD
jgi:hypothetical protein